MKIPNEPFCARWHGKHANDRFDNPTEMVIAGKWWGVASLVLLVVGWTFVEYNLYLYDHDRKMLFRSCA